MPIKNEQLNQYKPGQSGNPAGRPKGSLNRSTIARKWLEIEQSARNPITGNDETMSQEDMITLAQIRKARDGDTAAYKALMDSAHGSPDQNINQRVEADHVILKYTNAEDNRNTTP